MFKSLFTCMMLLVMSLTISAQKLPVFQNLTWEQAAAKAEKEGKLVLVDVMMKFGPVQQQKKQAAELAEFFNRPEINRFCKENTVAIRMDMMSREGKAFAPKMAMYMYPTLAFFMPDGDILEVLHPRQAFEHPESFLETGGKALDKAVVKRANTRSIAFDDLPFDAALAKAQDEHKLVFIDAYTTWCQPCMLMVKNVFSLDAVADFYNANFINLKLDFGKEKELSSRFKVRGYPSFLFVNGEGRLVYEAGGYTEEEAFIGYGREALKRAEGIDFLKDGSFAQALEQAEKEKKLVFMDCYTTWCGPCKQLAKKVFTDPEVGAFFNERFVNVKVDMEKEEGKALKERYGVKAFPTMFFINPEGEAVHTLVGGVKAEELIAHAEKALAGKGLLYLKNGYAAGNRNPEFIGDYLVALGEAYEEKTAEKVCLDYFSTLDRSKLEEKSYWDLFVTYVKDVHSELFRYVYNNRNVFCNLYGEKEVRKKIAVVWAIGANSYVQKIGTETVFDKKGFKKYTRRLAKADVDGKMDIIERSRMQNAEKLGDWRTYVDLGNVRLKAGQVGDMELYNWGLRINQHCQDPAIRTEAVHWMEDALERCIRMEESGKLDKRFSYRPAFEKLLSDLKNSVNQ